MLMSPVQFTSFDSHDLFYSMFPINFIQEVVMYENIQSLTKHPTPRVFACPRHNVTKCLLWSSVDFVDTDAIKLRCLVEFL